MKRIREIAATGALVGASLLVGLAAVELLLRVVAPEYRYAAESGLDENAVRLFANRPGASTEQIHPDTGASHPVIHNNLGLRQHRTITAADLARATIAVFGDSFAENRRLPVQYGFVDTLDYLLNAGDRPTTVLNFGVDGYGIDQAYLFYLASPAARRARHVLYLFSANDIRNLYENDLFALDAAGAVVRRPVPATPLLLRMSSRLYVTYFAIEIERMLRGRAAEGRNDLAERLNRPLEKARWRRYHSPRADAIEASFVAGDFDPIAPQLRLFEGLLEQWRITVEGDGGRLHVVLLPEEREQPLLRVLPPDTDLIDLLAEFRRLMPRYRREQAWLRRDPHWNEFGNMYAAITLARALEAADGRPVPGDAEIAARLARYYAAFPEGWRPRTLFGRPLDPDADGPGRETIRRKYLELELLD